MDISNLTQIDWNKYLFPQDTGFYLFLKIFCVLFDFSVVVFIIYVCATKPFLHKWFFWDWYEFFTFHSYYIKNITKDWNKIIRRVKTHLETEYKLAVIEADLLLNDTLYQTGHPGKTLIEKLEKVPEGRLSDTEGIKYADQFYQDLVNNPELKLDYEQTKKIILIFKQALTDLEVL
jgi:hypothetical protein